MPLLLRTPPLGLFFPLLKSSSAFQTQYKWRFLREVFQVFYSLFLTL